MTILAVGVVVVTISFHKFTLNWALVNRSCENRFRHIEDYRNDGDLF